MVVVVLVAGVVVAGVKMQRMMIVATRIVVVLSPLRLLVLFGYHSLLIPNEKWIQKQSWNDIDNFVSIYHVSTIFIFVLQRG
jgi:hypothetical protein